MQQSQKFTEFNNLKMNNNNYVIIGSGRMEVEGLREANDLDVVLEDNVFENFHRKYKVKNNFEKELDFSYEMLEWGNIRFYKQRPWEKFFIDNTVNERHSEIVSGYRVAKWDFILQRKKERGRQKDIQDIQTIKKHLMV